MNKAVVQVFNALGISGIIFLFFSSLGPLGRALGREMPYFVLLACIFALAGFILSIVFVAKAKR